MIDLQAMVKRRMGTTRTQVQSFWTNRRLSATALLVKTVGLLVSTALLPANGLVIEPAYAEEAASVQDEVPQLVLVPHNLESIILLPIRPQLTITVVESKAEQAAREAMRTLVTTSRSSVAPASVEVDASFEAKRALAQAAASEYGLDWKIVEAVWQVESGKRWQTTVRSSAGAQGPMQFMPGTWRAYQVDGNGDGVANVHDAQDAVYAGAKLLAANGGSSDIDRALFAYNHAQWYVDKVKGIAASIEG